MLLSPFVSLGEAIRSKPVISFLSRFAFYEFPVGENVSRTVTPCVITVVGMKDRIIPPEQGRIVSGRAKAPFSRLIENERGSHNDLIFRAYREITKAVQECLSAPR